MGVLGLVCTRMPDIQLGIIFLPGVQFTADTVRKEMWTMWGGKTKPKHYF